MTILVNNTGLYISEQKVVGGDKETTTKIKI
jgi:hypothetical protein